MDEKESSWDELIKEIGAAPPPDALERKRPAIETRFEPPPPDVQPAKPQRGDWNALADELGLEAREAPEPPRRLSPDAGPSSEALEASFASIAPMESAFEEITEEEISEIDFEEDDDSDFPEEADEPSEERDEPPSLSGEAARNAFEALFEAGSFAALPPLESPPRKPEGRPGPQWRDPDEVCEPVYETESADDSFDIEAPRREGTEPEADESGRPRRRRRRRGGRGRDRHRGERPDAREEGGEAAQDRDEWAARASGDEFDEGESPSERCDAEGEDRPRRRRRRRRGGAKSEASEGRPSVAGRNGQSPEADGDEDDGEPALIGGVDEDQEDDGDEDSKRAAHKNIPTWAEAIGVMVETNMQSRKNSPQRPGSPRDRDRGRGRGRGRGGRRGKS
jgi:hypothetical protein